MDKELLALFEGTELSEETKDKIKAIFQANLEEAEEKIRKDLEEKNEEQIKEKLEKIEESSKGYIEESVIPQIDKYLTAAVNEWLKENKLSAESSIKVELAESFMKGFIGLTEDHNLAVPENSESIVEKTQKELEELRGKLDKAIDEKLEMQESISEMKKESLIDKSFSDLTESQKEKVSGAAMKLKFESEDQFVSALTSLRESYFPDGKKAKEQEILDESKRKQLDEDDKDTNPYLKNFMKALG